MEDYLNQIETTANKAMETINILLTKALPPILKRLTDLETEVHLLNKKYDVSQQHPVPCTDDYERIKDYYVNLNSRVASIEDTIMEFHSNIEVKEVVEHEDNSKTTKQRHQTNYPTYIQIKTLNDNGFNEKDIAKELDIPYTTVRSYLRWTDTQLVKKKQQWESNKENKKYVEPKETVALNTTHIPELYPVEEQLSLPLISKNDPYKLNEWTSFEREQADKFQDYRPVDDDTIVIIVRDDNAYSMPYAAAELSWGTDSNITHWRLADRSEQAQYITRKIGDL